MFRERVGGVSRRALLRGRWRPAVLCAALVGSLAVGLSPHASAARPPVEDERSLYLVTLDGRGASAYSGPLTVNAYRSQLVDAQDRTLEAVGNALPVYRWTTALNGYAVSLTGAEARVLAAEPDVALVERNSVRKLAHTGTSDTVSAGLPGGTTRGGQGVVIGVIDSGIWPDSPVFAAVPGLGRAPRGFQGSCEEAEDWPASTCNSKLIAARWFVAGFGTDNISSSSSLSPRDDDGHGSQVASIAAGNSGVTVRVRGQRLGTYSGVAPQARLAVYKACWTAPDPDNDGCSSADLVTAIDRATADGVDVLNLSVAGPAQIDTVDRALLGAVEGDVFVAAAAGNDSGYAAHPAPWVTTVAATVGRQRRGELALPDGPTVTGAMVSSTGVGPARVVLADDIAAPGARTNAARLCRPGTLDAAKAAGRIVVCDRGAIGRVDKSRAVQLADGVGMILANTQGVSTAADFHDVPTLHLAETEAATVREWVRDNPESAVTLRPAGFGSDAPRISSWSARGNPRSGVVKPDVATPGSAVLGATPPAADSDQRWNFASGTSASAAQVSGQAAVLRAKHRWSPTAVRSALMTSAAPLVGDVPATAQGSGRSQVLRANRPGLVYDEKLPAYRRYLRGEVPAVTLNQPSIMLRGERAAVTRKVTNVGTRAMYYSAHVVGMRHHRVQVTPAAIKIAPGETRTFRVTNLGPHAPRALDSGWITWLGANGITVRIPLVIAR